MDELKPFGPEFFARAVEEVAAHFRKTVIDVGLANGVSEEDTRKALNDLARRIRINGEPLSTEDSIDRPAREDPATAQRIVEWRIRLSRLRLLRQAARSTWQQLKMGPKTSGRGTPVLSIWPADLKRGWLRKPWIWEIQGSLDGDCTINDQGQLVSPPLLNLVYIRMPRRPIVIQLAWEARPGWTIASQSVKPETNDEFRWVSE